MSSNINDYTTLHTDYNWEDVCINLKHHQQTCTSEGGLIFKSGFYSCIIVDLIMQDEFRCVNLIGRIRRTWKTHQITPHMPWYESWSSGLPLNALSQGRIHGILTQVKWRFKNSKVKHTIALPFWCWKYIQYSHHATNWYVENPETISSQFWIGCLRKSICSLPVKIGFWINLN